MRVTALCNQKGGVGKTTLTAETAERLSREGSVLVIDLDPQANLTALMGVPRAEGMLTINDVLADVARGGRGNLMQTAVPAADAWGAVAVVPAERLLASRESDVALGRESRLAAALDGVTGYDHVLIDCPPSLGMLTTNALVAADQTLIVTEPRSSSVEAVGEMVSTLSSVRLHYNPKVILSGLVVNKWLAGRTDRQAWLTDLQAEYGEYVVLPPVPEREALAHVATSKAPLAITSGLSDVEAALTAIADRVKGIHS